MFLEREISVFMKKKILNLKIRAFPLDTYLLKKILTVKVDLGVKVVKEHPKSNLFFNKLSILFLNAYIMR